MRNKKILVIMMLFVMILFQAPTVIFASAPTPRAKGIVVIRIPRNRFNEGVVSVSPPEEYSLRAVAYQNTKPGDSVFPIIYSEENASGTRSPRVIGIVLGTLPLSPDTIIQAVKQGTGWPVTPPEEHIHFKLVHKAPDGQVIEISSEDSITDASEKPYVFICKGDSDVEYPPIGFINLVWAVIGRNI
ncbi:MAG: hypothetical protein NkDv07_0277 [Candidatus Improbicoccus devescovinae]|nr:MAG: hypothetical protein NkDv07_0277 [Candidatus Improbicoccus devescovinae]